MVIEADLADPLCVASLVPRIEAEAGPIDILVNNAGVAWPRHFADYAPSDLSKLFGINLLAPVGLTRAVLPGMLERGRGHIVNISSVAGVSTSPGLVAYCASKAGLSHFSEALRLDLLGTPVGITLVELDNVRPSRMMDEASSSQGYAPTRILLEHLEKYRFSVKVPRENVAKAIMKAIQLNRRHVRLPRRAIPMLMLAGLPRRFSEMLYRMLSRQN